MSRKPYVRPMPNCWWLEKAFYIKYMIRESSSFFLGVYSAMIVVGLWRLSEGEAFWNTYLSALTSPFSILFQIVGFAFSVYHSVTFFDVTPRTMPIMIGDEFLPDAPKLTALYVAWGIVTAIILAVVLL